MKTPLHGGLLVAAFASAVGASAGTAPPEAGDVQPSAAGETFVVGVDAPTVAETVALARDGDSVEVPSGTWAGPVRVDAAITLRGPGTVDGGGVGSAVVVAAPGARITGLSVRNSGNDVGRSDACIYVEPTATGARLEGNTLYDCAFGIWVHEADYVRVSGNDVTGRPHMRPTDRGNGIHLFDGEHLVVEDNTVRDVRDGLYVAATDDSLIAGNEAHDVRFGVHYMYSYRNTVRDNVVTDSTVGLALMESRELRVVGNVATGNERTGLLFRDATGCQIEGNRLERNGQGMFFFSSTENTIRGNRIAGNEVGVKMWAGSLRNMVADNAFVANAQQVFYVGAEDQVWGEASVGNHWSDYVGWDQDGDGIGDRPHRVDSFTATLIHRFPSAVLLLRSPALELLTHLEARMPMLRRPTVVDLQPRMSP